MRSVFVDICDPVDPFFADHFLSINAHVQVLIQRIEDVVIVRDPLLHGLCAGVPLGEAINVRIFDPNPFDNLSSLIITVD